MHHVQWHLFHEFLFVNLFILPDTDIIIALLQYFVCCITHSFQLQRKTTFDTALNNALMYPLTSGILDSKHVIFAEGGHFKHKM